MSDLFDRLSLTCLCCFSVLAERIMLSTYRHQWTSYLSVANNRYTDHLLFEYTAGKHQVWSSSSGVTASNRIAS